MSDMVMDGRIEDAAARLANNDPLLAPFLCADETAADPEIEQLIARSRPLIERIAARYAGPHRALPGHEAEDVLAAVSLRLLDKLRRTRVAPGEAIQSVENYVSTLTHNVINDHLRRRFPERTRLKNRLRYVLTHDHLLDLWSLPGVLACGKRSWTGTSSPSTSIAIETFSATRVMRNRDRPAAALYAVFDAVGRPATLDALLDFTAEIWHVVDFKPVEFTADVAVHAEGVARTMERREFLGALWREIQQLRPMQRKALLLNLREGPDADAISLLLLTGTASFDAIAAALEMTADALSAIWNELPFDDLRIASFLGITRQQVINLRGAARARLQRRLIR